MHLIITLPRRHRSSLLGRLAVPPRRGSYQGRLAFDPYTEFHTDPQGRRVVTDDGTSWRYAKFGAASHNARHHKGEAHVITLTTKEAFDVGHPDHAHHELWQPGVLHPDAVAPVQTSHTDAWTERA